jgi:hypothetical protein
LACASLLAGCGPQAKSLPEPEPYVDQGYKPDVPQFMHGTVFERTDLGNADPYPVGGYSIVVNLQDTGDNSGIPTVVRQEMIKRMALAGFGQHDDPQFTALQPEDVLRDKRVAIVQVIGMLPVGARRGQQFDLIVRAMPRSHTTSLAHGHLYKTELHVRGLELPTGTGATLAFADAGDIFVNPEYALDGINKTYPGVTASQVQATLDTGTVMRGGLVTEDRPIFLQLRVPQASIARAIEARVINRFPNDENDRPAAAAEDEGLVELFVPYSYNGDWRHFVGVVNHLYLNDTADFAAVKTHQLMELAVTRHAPLTDISFCLEGMGPTAVPVYQSLMTDPDPAVAFAAARAAVFCGDAQALDVLTGMATQTGHPFQLEAIRTIGSLQSTPALDKRLEPLLGSEQAQVRIEAYKILAAHGDRRIVTADINGRFKLDLVDYPGPPLIYAARSGEARLAIFGNTPTLTPPVTFAAMQDRLTISSDDLGRSLTIFYREDRLPKPSVVKSGTTLAEVVSRLGGRAAEGEDTFDFTYADVVAVVQSLTDQQVITDTDPSGRVALAPLIVDQPAELTDALTAAGLESRPQADPIRPPTASNKQTASDTALLTTPGSDASQTGSYVPSFGGSSGSGSTGGGSTGGATPAQPGDNGNVNNGGVSPSVPSFANP